MYAGGMLKGDPFGKVLFVPAPWARCFLVKPASSAIVSSCSVPDASSSCLTRVACSQWTSLGEGESLFGSWTCGKKRTVADGVMRQAKRPRAGGVKDGVGKSARRAREIMMTRGGTCGRLADQEGKMDHITGVSEPAVRFRVVLRMSPFPVPLRARVNVKPSFWLCLIT